MIFRYFICGPCSHICYFQTFLAESFSAKWASLINILRNFNQVFPLSRPAFFKVFSTIYTLSLQAEFALLFSGLVVYTSVLPIITLLLKWTYPLTACALRSFRMNWLFPASMFQSCGHSNSFSVDSFIKFLFSAYSYRVNFLKMETWPGLVEVRTGSEPVCNVNLILFILIQASR